MLDKIKIIGAKENNLKNIHLEIPKNKLIVFTGLSGSGKSTLAFDTLYAEGQRRYIESLSSYARQFLDKVGKPNVDKIEGLTPAIAIDQKTTSKNPRSTVGTITEIYDYLRLLFARVGTQHCHLCGKPISQMSQTDIIDQILSLPQESKIIILAPIVKEKKGSFNDKIQDLRQKGYVRAYIDGVMVRLDEEIELSKTKKHTIKVIIDRVIINKENHSRIAQAIEKALKETYGELEIEIIKDDEKNNEFIHYSEHLACFDCKVSFEPLEPLSFSFNSPKGACENCGGLGSKYSIDIKKILDKSLPLNKGGIKVIFGFNRSYYAELFSGFCKTNKIDGNKTFEDLKEHEQNALLYGNGNEVEFIWKNSTLKRPWKGIIQIAYDMFKDEKDLGDYMSEKPCSTCNGHRLKAPSLNVKVSQKGIGDIIDMPIEESYSFFNNDDNFSYLTKQQSFIAASILKEIKERLFFLYDVGLGYLSLGRDARTISGGESQRIRIASQIGSGLTGVMYVLDEPSIGLHERDTLKLIKTLRNLQEKGNTVIVVEHDKETIKNADFIVDIGPGAGKNGGEVVFAGTIEKMLTSNTQTSQYINGKKTISYPHNRPQKKWLEIKNVTINNIKSLNLKIPLSNFVCITGVSGSGKSSLILQTLLPVAQELLNNAKKIKKCDGVEIDGLEMLDKVIYLDQSPIGRTPRSNPATYTGVMDDIRTLFSEVKEAKILGYGIGRFSFNVKGGRCEKCQGEGEIKIEMHFLPDVMVKCDACNGAKYNPQTLEIKYKGKSIADVLNMSVDDACEFFCKIPKIASKLKTLQDVGLGYITLGQNAVTLSGGEAQRIKLAKELSRKDTGKTLYILDEPTTGLHFADVDRLTKVLHHLVELGNSMIVIEHNLDMIKNADYIIDIGPEGGDKGGKIVDIGTPTEIAKNAEKSHSYTAKFLAQELEEDNKNAKKTRKNS
ncbi:excinuclease ABC subunit UvrA [Helicobacter cappadocius]|uniref:UvrABC system protein A n=1 Tax=Helicobacter cappadocius TaxID=3063998 RepID=A0AA90PSH3_9HELI|nr:MULTISPECIES: excinuclease ABC subunit UvrA [unclassified Helicobacter]MDO7253399.1 excinuclease ABC subunit UvrA [Helicobacter sp. faydin-H75]MDP2539337.1 excinuclease ABC subunit UvrA [Helicobacter sp. faydin-H76]